MRKLLLILLLLAVLPVWASATEIPAPDESIGTLRDGLPKEATELMPDQISADPGEWTASFREVLENALEKFSGLWKNAWKSSVLLLAIVILCGSLEKLCLPEAKSAIVLGGTVSMAVCCAANVSSLVGLGESTIGSMLDFIRLLIPMMASTAAISGAVATAGALSAASLLFFNSVLTVILELFVPLVYAFIAMGLISSSLGQTAFQKIKKSLGNVLRHGLRIIMFVFTTYLSLSGLVAGSVDKISLKAAKMAVSTAVPVVGGIVSDAAESVLVGAGTVQSSLGIFGMVSVLSILILPFLRIGVQYLILQVSTVSASFLGIREHLDFLETICSAMGYILAMTGCAGLCCFFSCICFMKVTAP